MSLTDIPKPWCEFFGADEAKLVVNLAAVENPQPVMIGLALIGANRFALTATNSQSKQSLSHAAPLTLVDDPVFLRSTVERMFHNVCRLADNRVFPKVSKPAIEACILQLQEWAGTNE